MYNCVYAGASQIILPQYLTLFFSSFFYEFVTTIFHTKKYLSEDVYDVHEP